MRLPYATQPSTKREGPLGRGRSGGGGPAAQARSHAGAPCSADRRRAADSHCSSLPLRGVHRAPPTLVGDDGGGGLAGQWIAADPARAPRVILLEGLARVHEHQRVMRMPCRESRRRRTGTVERERRRCGRKKGVSSVTNSQQQHGPRLDKHLALGSGCGTQPTSRTREQPKAAVAATALSGAPAPPWTIVPPVCADQPAAL